VSSGSSAVQRPDLVANFPKGLLALVDQRSGIRAVETTQLFELQLQGDEKLRSGVVEISRNSMAHIRPARFCVPQRPVVAVIGIVTNGQNSSP